MFVSVDELDRYIDQPLEASDWLRIDQDMIDRFAHVTHDHQFIHVDPERAALTPLGGTIAHGYLTLSLVAQFAYQCAVRPRDAVMSLNYGSDKVRFLQPVKVDSDIRAHPRLLSVTEKSPGRILLKTRMSIEIKGEERPALIAEILGLFVMQ